MSLNLLPSLYIATLLLLSGFTISQISSFLASEKFLPEKHIINHAKNIVLGLGITGALTILYTTAIFFFSCSTSSCLYSALVFEKEILIVETIIDLNFYILIDSISAIFIGLSSLIAISIYVYSFKWLDEENSAVKNAGFINLLLLSIVFVFIIDNGFWLLIALEANSLAIVPLMHLKIVNDSSDSGSIALQDYLNNNQLSLSLFLIAILILIALTDNWQLSLYSSELTVFSKNPTLPYSASILLIFTSLIIRAGMMPFQQWIPNTHVYLPTNSHAFVSSIILKIPAYLFFRFFFQHLAINSVFWGLALMLISSITAISTIISANEEQNLKRVLALHSVENVSLIFFAIALAMSMNSYTFITPPEQITIYNGVVGIGLVIAIFHCISHAFFKTALFLGIGNLEKYAEIRSKTDISSILKITSFMGGAFFIAILSIIGIPGTNGFISKGLIFLLQLAVGELLTEFRLEAFVLFLAISIGLVIFTMATLLTLTAFRRIIYKLYQRSGDLTDESVENSKINTDKIQNIPILVLAIICLAMGLFPTYSLYPLQSAVKIFGFDSFSILNSSLTGIEICLNSCSEYRISLSIIPIAFIYLFLALAFLFNKWLSRGFFSPSTTFPPGPGGENRGDNPMVSDSIANSHIMGQLNRVNFLKDHLSPVNWIVEKIDKYAAPFSKKLQPGYTSPYLLYLLIILIVMLFGLLLLSQ